MLEPGPEVSHSVSSPAMRFSTNSIASDGLILKNSLRISAGVTSKTGPIGKELARAVGKGAPCSIPITSFVARAFDN